MLQLRRKAVRTLAREPEIAKPNDLIVKCL